MHRRGLLRPLFTFWVAMSVGYVCLVLWWALLIAGPERFSVLQWVVMVFVPPAVMLGRFFLRAWIYGGLSKR
jgi:hypothetical protein